MFTEREINIMESIKVPNTYWKGKSREYQFFFRSLLQKIDSALIFKGLPKDWSQDFFLLCLWALGYVAVFKSERFGDKETGMAFQPCTLSGFDFYYQPTIAKIANPKYQADLEIHKKCEILKLTPDFFGIFDIIDHWATQLAECSKGIYMGLINAKMPMVLSANNASQAETLKKIYDKVQNGDPLVVWKDQTQQFGEVIPRKDPFEVWNQDFKQTYVVTNLLDDMQKILDQFYTEIGLPVAIEKSAHALDQEADFQAAQSQARIACWVATLNESFKQIEATFGLHLEVEYAREDNVSGTGESSEHDENGRY